MLRNGKKYPSLSVVRAVKRRNSSTRDDIQGKRKSNAYKAQARRSSKTKSASMQSTPPATSTLPDINGAADAGISSLSIPTGQHINNTLHDTIAISDVDSDTAIVSPDTRTLWRQCLKDVQHIHIPSVKGIRPTRTRNTFVTWSVVVLAYLIVNAEDGKPIPNISPSFKINQSNNMDDIEQEIIKGGLDYMDDKMKWNDHDNVNSHLGACTRIGSWLANTRNKAKNHGTWKVVEGHLVGSTHGLYEPYRNLLMKIGFKIPSSTQNL